MKKLTILLLIVSLCYSCRNKNYSNKEPYSFIPDTSQSLLKINTLRPFINSITNLKILANIHPKPLTNTIDFLKLLNTSKPVYISFSETTTNNSHSYIFTENTTTLLDNDSILNRADKLSTDIKTYNAGNQLFYYKTFHNIFLASTDLEFIEKTDAETENNTFNKLIKASDKNANVSVFFNTKHSSYNTLLLSNSKNNPYTNGYCAIDLNFNDNSISFNGVISTKDSIANKFNTFESFKNSNPQPLKALKIMPNSTTSFTSINFDNYRIFQERLNSLHYQKNETKENFLDYANEITQTENAIIIHSLDIDLITDFLDTENPLETFKSTRIYKYSESNFFSEKLKPYIRFKTVNYFAFYDEFILFSEHLDDLKNILNNALNNTTLSTSEAFINLTSKLNTTATLFRYKNNEGLYEILNDSNANYNSNAVQYTKHKNYTHVNGVFENYLEKSNKNSVKEFSNFKLDHEALTAPQYLKNSSTDIERIAIQDLNYNLYLFSDTGKRIWKIQLEDKILGEINEIDPNKNGEFKLAFATKSKIHIIDKSGKYIQNFPVNFKDEITQPLAVFDYDNLKNYRLLITQGKTLFMLDSKGKTVKGFNYTPNDEIISSTPKHFRIKTNDYIVFKTNMELKVLNRRGKPRINVKEKINFSDNHIYNFDDELTTIDTIGDLINIDLKGNVRRLKQEILNPNYFNIKRNLQVIQSENRLKIASKNIDLDYGNYTKPKIVFTKNNTFVTTTDLQSKKVYVFNTTAILISGFPIYGISEAELYTVNKSLRLLTLTDKDIITVFTLN